MKDCIFPLIVVLGIIIAYLISKYRQAKQKNTIKELAAWTITENSNTFRCNIHLHEYVANEQIHLLEEYRISREDEWKMIKEIPLDVKQQITKLKTLGLLIEDETTAEKFLNDVS